MIWPYRLSRSARRDLQEISDYWTERAGPEVALGIISEVIETILLLSQQQGMGARWKSSGRVCEGFRQADTSSTTAFREAAFKCCTYFTDRATSGRLGTTSGSAIVDPQK
jgi:plasmid stabilization system protein ParE